MTIHFNHKKDQTQKSKLAAQATMTALAGALLLNGEASAQSWDTVVDVTAVDGIASAQVQADGSLLLITDDGQTYTLPQGSFTTQGSGFFVPADFAGELGVWATDAATVVTPAVAPVAAPVASTSAAGGVSPLLIGLGAAAIAGGVAVGVSGGGDDDDDAPAPIPNEAPVVTNDTAFSVAENQTDAFTATASDADADSLAFSLTGADAGAFNIDAATGVVTFDGAPDFEALADADGDNIFDVTVNASDGTDTSTQDVAITVTDVDETPVITSVEAVSVAENQTAVVTATAGDPEGDTVTFSLSGADAALFAIDAATGVITFVGAPDFETPADADGDNVFDLVLTASDGTNTSSQNLAVTVTDVIDPVIGLDNVDDVLVGGPEANILDGLSGADQLDGGDGDDILISDGFDVVLNGGEGVDTLDISGVMGIDTSTVVDSITTDFGFNETFPVFVDLLDLVETATFGFEDINGGPNVLGVLNIENVIGSDFNDFVFGGDAFNEISSGLGNDFLNGEGGNDVLNGDAGDDFLFGSDGEDVLNGGAGDDFLQGGDDNDTIDGGTGFDTVVVDAEPEDVTVVSNVDGTFTLITPFDGTDTLTNVEAIVNNDGTPIPLPAPPIMGTTGDDVLSGTPDNDTIVGLAGNDMLTGGAGDDALAGGGGTDIIDGGAGNDTNSFAGIGLGVTAVVAADGTGTAVYGGVNESFTGIENLIGTGNDDILTATGDVSNILSGGAGDDIIEGGGGADILGGDDGDDTLISDGLDLLLVGGAGVDTVDFSGVTGVDTNASLSVITTAFFTGTFNTRTDLLDNEAAFDFGNGTVITNVSDAENIIGTDFNDFIEGNDDVNELSGGLGNDFFNGQDGDDIIMGNAGDDLLFGNDGDDTLIGGVGDDLLDGGDDNDTIDGGAGFDTVVVRDDLVDISFTDNGDGTITLTTLTDGIDTLTNVEAVVNFNGDTMLIPAAVVTSASTSSAATSASIFVSAEDEDAIFVSAEDGAVADEVFVDQPEVFEDAVFVEDNVFEVA